MPCHPFLRLPTEIHHEIATVTHLDIFALSNLLQTSRAISQYYKTPYLDHLSLALGKQIEKQELNFRNRYLDGGCWIFGWYCYNKSHKDRQLLDRRRSLAQYFSAINFDSFNDCDTEVAMHYWLLSPCNSTSTRRGEGNVAPLPEEQSRYQLSVPRLIQLAKRNGVWEAWRELVVLLYLVQTDVEYGEKGFRLEEESVEAVDTVLTARMRELRGETWTRIAVETVRALVCQNHLDIYHDVRAVRALPRHRAESRRRRAEEE